jgi:pyruvate,water dikinase
VFFDFCKKAFPETADQTVARMVAGIEVLMFRPDDELKRLAKLAIDFGVDDSFAADCDLKKILDVLRGRGEPGKRWLAARHLCNDQGRHRCQHSRDWQART